MKSSQDKTQNICTSTNLTKKKEIAPLATSLANEAVGEKVRETVKNSPRSIAVLSVIKEDVLDLSHENVAIFSAPEVALVPSNPTV